VIQTFIDAKNAQNINIWMAKYKKIGFAGVIQAVISMDMEVFPDSSAVNSLLTFIPTEDEVATMNDWVNQEGPEKVQDQMKLMGTAEQFCIDYVNIPQLKERLEVFKFVLEFFPKQSEMGPQIASLLKCSKYIVEEKKNHQIFRNCNSYW